MKAEQTKSISDPQTTANPRRARKKTGDSFQGLGVDVDAEADSHTLATSEMQPRAKLSVEMIAHRAYELWEREGCPCGKSDEHWQQAERELSSRQ